jgi:hypothetical protein
MMETQEEQYKRFIEEWQEDQLADVQKEDWEEARREEEGR